MSMNLDHRQRAMLAEMGVRVWQPVPSAMATTPVVAPVDASGTSPRTETVKPLNSRTALSAPPALSANVSVTPTSAIHPIPLPAGLPQMDWQQLKSAAASCRACALCENRTHSVFADGSPAADNRPTDLLIIGDAPSDAEDATGTSFGGVEGVLLDAMLKAMGLSRPDSKTGDLRVVLVNALKCRGSTQRHPSTHEISQCHSYLLRQIALTRPRVILALGRLAAQAVLHDSTSDAAQLPLGKLRGQLHHVHGYRVIVSYHPAYLLRTPSDKTKAWADLCQAMQLLKEAAG